MTTVGCSTARPLENAAQERQPIVEDPSLTHAYDTSLEMRLLDRLELDNFLRQRDILLAVEDGVVVITGVVFTPLEKQRASALVRQVPGVIDVANELAVEPPE